MNKSTKKRKLLVAFSGGVDSSVASLLTQQAGDEVIACTLKLFSRENCANDDEEIAKTAAHMGIPHHFLNLESDFTSRVLRYSWEEYRRGRTPNPCARCNPNIKFGLLMEHALDLGCDGVVTGHHARISREEDGSPVLRRGLDPNKDQSYFLFALSPEQLDKTFFPIGEMTKSDVREIARKHSLKSAERQESQDACFAMKGEAFPELLQEFFDEKSQAGRFVTGNDQTVGEHQGVHRFTIGQRKGLGVALGKPAYISSIDPKTGDVHLSTDEKDLLRESLTTSNMNWQIAHFANSPFNCEIQIRYRQRPVKAQVTPDPENDKALVEFENPQRAVTPGQAAVFYDQDRVIGGGWID